MVQCALWILYVISHTSYTKQSIEFCVIVFSERLLSTLLFWTFKNLWEKKNAIYRSFTTGSNVRYNSSVVSSRLMLNCHDFVRRTYWKLFYVCWLLTIAYKRPKLSQRGDCLPSVVPKCRLCGDWLLRRWQADRTVGRSPTLLVRQRICLACNCSVYVVAIDNVIINHRTVRVCVEGAGA